MDMMKGKKLSSRSKQIIYIVFVFFCLLVLGIVISMTLKSSKDSQEFLIGSVKSQLISISAAAKEIIDTDEFISYTTPSDIADNERYAETLRSLRALAVTVDAKYIYALKQIDGKYYFIFDTDPEVDTSFTEYPLSQVHLDAFAGKSGADIMNVDDEFGSFNTGAVPILKDGRVVGIVSADIEDRFLIDSIKTAERNTAILVVILVVIFMIMSVMLFFMLNRIKSMQDELEHMAHYDKLTELPNRLYLLDHLAAITARKPQPKFALLFIDLDNFKKVNDNAGHDAGDALLSNIGRFFESAHQSSKVFRPGAGALNVAARIGGDEFILLVPHIETTEEAEIFAAELLQNFKNANDLIDKYIQKYQVGLSIGIALYPYHSENYHVLLKYADIAMYHSKDDGKNCFRIYSEELRPKDEK